jgi:hypothetical protein
MPYPESSLNDAFLAFDRASSHTNPAFDFLTGMVPRRLKDLFRWCEYLTFNSAHIYASLRKFGELVVTEILYDTPNEALRRQYNILYSKHLKIKSALLMASFDKHVYGNHFTSLYQPFVRSLVCDQCQAMTNIQHVDYEFEIKTLKFKFKCPSCDRGAIGRVEDRKLLSINRMHIIRWDPKVIDIEHNPITGESSYYYNIPEEIKKKVRSGSKLLIDTMPLEFLEAIRDDKVFAFEKDAIFHMKVPSPSGMDQQWGFPPLTATIKLFLYTLTLRKANEAIAMEHILPFRIMTPAGGPQDPSQFINLARWQDEMKANLRQWRKDPLHVMFAPTAVQVTNVGGEGRAMLTLGEVQEADKAILAAMGLPPEFLYGGLTKAGMEGNLRMLQNQLQNHADDMNDLLQWYTDKISKFLGWERIETKLMPMQMLDDVEAKQMIVGLATGQMGQQLVSMSTVAERFGLDLDAERSKRLQEQLDETRHQMRVQTEVQKLQNNLQSQVQSQAAAQSGAGMGYDQQKVIAAADNIVSQLMQLDAGSRRSQLHSLQMEDMVLYSVVIQRLEDYQNSQTQAAKTQMAGQAMV